MESKEDGASGKGPEPSLTLVILLKEVHHTHARQLILQALDSIIEKDPQDDVRVNSQGGV
ncbi:hypothetical protein [Shewanella violacea]|uniref:Uncharacterized protein n=1 Tax=Shewanella violacea (strain JCM 10179 / CIP 106290 / LMG 19151 / DSS12) TaxID=637905 RepID=D4ZF23_SHEVD|nr:hypothetical protein [Shewanella violacea]BAJ04187.1 hypothetical protein SVI_4216 [Shewanella violacea DSS12]